MLNMGKPAIYKFRILPLESLNLWERNYRDGNVAIIRNSIQRFGFNSTVRVLDGVVYAGNHSIKALKELQESGAPPPVGIETSRGRWMVPCTDLSHLSEEEAMAFAIADNRASDLAENDDEALAALLSELGSGFQEDLGFSNAELDLILSKLHDPAAESAFDEWVGMPEYEQQAATAWRSVVFHFHDADGLAEFEKLIGRSLTNRFAWWPDVEITRSSKVRYVSETEVEA